MTVDLLADWWVHEVQVARYIGQGARGDQWADPEPVVGFYSDKNQYEAGQVVASGRFAFPSSVAPVPLKSTITLPVTFGGRTVRVVSTAVGDGGGQPTPDHQQIGVL